jgi:hypothetical protein
MLVLRIHVRVGGGHPAPDGMTAWALVGLALFAVPGCSGFAAVPGRLPGVFAGALARGEACSALLRAGRASSRRGLRVRCYSDAGGSDGGSGPESTDPVTLSFADGLREHLAGIWGPSGGEDFSLYSPNVEFKDPLASYTGIETYKQALQLLKNSRISNSVQFQTHDVSVVGKGHVRARWCAWFLLSCSRTVHLLMRLAGCVLSTQMYLVEVVQDAQR